MVKKRITLADIAKELNVSIGLVSMVLSGKSKENRISEDIAKKVNVKAIELGYQANIMARGLRTGKSGIIGLAVADIANPYFGKLARHIENEASKLGYQLMFGSSDEDAEKLSSILNVFRSRQVDGVIVVPVENTSACIKSITDSMPMVFVDRLCNDVTEDAIYTDNKAGAIQLNNLLIEKGYKNIAAFVYSLELSNNHDRIEGYIESIQNSKLTSQSPLVFKIDFDNVKESLEDALENALRKGCDALFFANNNLGIESLKILHSINEDLPMQLGIVSFDNPEAFHVSRPGITCYEQPIEEMSEKATKLLIKKIEKNRKKKPHVTLLQGELILRDSH